MESLFLDHTNCVKVSPSDQLRLNAAAEASTEAAKNAAHKEAEVPDSATAFVPDDVAVINKRDAYRLPTLCFARSVLVLTRLTCLYDARRAFSSGFCVRSF
jgi:hypothetical protein